MQSKPDFDIHFDFRKDSGGKDPDIGSPTLRRYHRILWSKKLPNGDTMQLTHSNGGYLKWKNYEFGSDAMINDLFYTRAKKSIPILKDILRDYDGFVENSERNAWTIGGEIIFPRHGNSMNQLRGTNAYIMDRWDLTLECIRRFYLNEKSPLYDVLDRDRYFYELFVDFKGYVDFFFLQDCVTSDYRNVIFWQDDCSLTKTMPLPETAGEHLVWTEKTVRFINKRAERMVRALECDPAYINATSSIVTENNSSCEAEKYDDYYEILDEVINQLRRDDSLDVSTKRLRATRYSNGYARYVRINGYSCAILFDRANWKDPESIMTPFWLGITDSKWKLTVSIRAWIYNNDESQIATKWQNQPCLALIPVPNEPFHQMCEHLAQQIVDAIRELEKWENK